MVITNDAWFSKSAAAYQHLQASQFRAVENSMPVIRSANTGISAFISARGKAVDRVKDKEGYDSFIMGGLARTVTLNAGETFYQKYGFCFPEACLLFVLFSFVWTFVRHRTFKGEIG